MTCDADGMLGCCCAPHVAVISPFDSYCWGGCCGGCQNEVTGGDNCYGLCGPVTGNPKSYQTLAVQAVDADAFVADAQKALDDWSMGGGK